MNTQETEEFLQAAETTNTKTLRQILLRFQGDPRLSEPSPLDRIAKLLHWTRVDHSSVCEQCKQDGGWSLGKCQISERLAQATRHWAKIAAGYTTLDQQDYLTLIGQQEPQP